MRHFHSAEDDEAPSAAELGAEFASQTSFRIRGGRGAEVADLFRKLGLSGPEDFTIPPAVYAAAMAHIPNSARRLSLELGAGADPSAPSELPGTSGRDVTVATRMLETADVEEPPVLATELVQLQPAVAAPSYGGAGTKSRIRAVELDTAEASTREVAAEAKQSTAHEEKGKSVRTKVDRLRVERTEAVVLEAARETTGAVVQVAAESTSRSVEHYYFSPSPHRRIKRTITSWIKGQHLGSGSFGSVYEAISE